MQPEGSETGAVSITVLSVKPMRSGKLFALASVELDIDGVRIEIHGIRALRVDPVGTRIELPKFRDANGLLRTAVVLPEEGARRWATSCSILLSIMASRSGGSRWRFRPDA